MNNFSIRKKCIFCHAILTKEYFKNNKNIYISSNICDYENNFKKSIPYNILICTNCGSYQNKYLGDLNLVYNDNHNNVIISDIWIEHYNNFYNFIVENNFFNKNSYILEIGAGNNYIVNLFLKDNYNNYNILEPVITNKISNVKYTSGWLEDFNNEENLDIVILSHVFEHLYEPKELFKIKSKYIAISIPNIPKYIDNFVLNFLNIEHTFYFEEEHIIILFNNNKYKLIKKNDYLDHSIFMLFEYDESLKKKSYDNKMIININSKFDIYFNKIYVLIKNINNYINTSNNKLAIFPANMYIQYLICLGLDVNNISYFYDNNKNKTDKYLYGTNIICKNLEYFISNNEYEIILLGFLYNDEIIKILKKYNIKYFTYN